MPSGQVDLKGQLKAFPYVKPLVADSGREAEEEALDFQEFIDSLSDTVSEIPSDITELVGLGSPPGAGIVGTDNWKTASLGDSLGFIGGITSGLEKSLNTLDKIISTLDKILRIIELFINGFNSFSKLILSAINLAQNKLNEYVDDTMKLGVYANVLAPPALMTKSIGDVNSMNQLRGGFEGFLTRLDSSVNNPKDVNRPIYGVNDYVGGLVIMLDTELLADMWTGMSQLIAMFDFMGGFGLNMRPPPPTEIQGFCGYFTDPDDATAKKYGIQIEWNQTYTATGFNIYRSRIPGGTAQVEEYIPRTLQDDEDTGEPGLLSLVRTLFLNLLRTDDKDESFVLPERTVQVYKDPDFNDGEPVYVPAGVGKTLTYTDFFITTETINVSGTELHVPVIDDNGKKVPITNYYYVIKACGAEKDKDVGLFEDPDSKEVAGTFEGPDSKEVVVALKSCNDGYKLADIISHPNGTFEFLSVGAGKINSWSSVQLNNMIPWFGEAVGLLSKFLESLKGMVTGASESFSDFLDQIKGKIQLYINLLSVVSWFIDRLSEFTLGPSISFLNVTPAKGGMPVFLERVRGAQPPDGESFSGPNGITVGAVLVYGASSTQMPQLKALQKAFEFIYSTFTDR